MFVIPKQKFYSNLDLFGYSRTLELPESNDLFVNNEDLNEFSKFISIVGVLKHHKIHIEYITVLPKKLSNSLEDALWYAVSDSFVVIYDLGKFDNLIFKIYKFWQVTYSNNI